MAAVGFRRLFWIGAAALLAAAALISIVALLRGEFTETDGKILGTLGAAFLTGSASLAGLALVDRRDLVPLGWLVAAVGPLAFAVITWEVWRDLDGENLLLDTLIVAFAALLVATARLLHRRLEPLYWTSVALTVATAAALGWAVHADPPSDTFPKALGTLGILTGLAWFLVPVLGRMTGGGGDRVIGSGPGHFEVDLDAGEQLVVRAAR